jgi:hypothetical protein
MTGKGRTFNNSETRQRQLSLGETGHSAIGFERQEGPHKALIKRSHKLPRELYPTFMEDYRSGGTP